MQTAFIRARTNRTKAKYLQEFNQALQKTRAEIATDLARQKRVQASMSAMMGHFNMLACVESTSELELEKALKKQVVNFNAELDANREFSAERISQLLPIQGNYHFTPQHTNSDYLFTAVDTKVERENLRQAYMLCKQARAVIRVPYENDFRSPIELGAVISPSSLNKQERIDRHLTSASGRMYRPEVGDGLFDTIAVANLIKEIEHATDAHDYFGFHYREFSSIAITATDALTHSYSSLFTKHLERSLSCMTFQDGIAFDRLDLTQGFIDTQEEEAITIPQVKEYWKDLTYFMASFQKACQDPRFRKEFLLKINKDEAWFRKLAEVLTYKARAQRSQTRTDNAVYKKYDRDFFYPCYLEADDQNRLSRLYREALKKLDTQFHAGQVVEDLDLREYSPGDPVRHVNWKATGKSDKIYVAKQPRTEAGINTPLHVLINIGDSTLVRLQMLELVRTLQQDIKRTNREIFIAFKQAGYYVKLSPRIDPKVIVQSLMDNQPKNQVSHLDSRGRPVNNLVYVSNDYNAISGMEYLYKGLPRRNISSIYLKDPKYDVYPQIDKAWAEEAK